MTIDRSVRIGIFTGIVATALFIYFIDPIFSFAGGIILKVASNIYTSYVDRLFMKASVGIHPYPSFALMSFVFGILSGFPFGMLGFFLGRMIQKKHEKNDTQDRLLKRLFLFVSILLIIVSISLFITTWSIWFQLRLTTSFEQHMRAVAPYITEQEERVFFSRWAQMQNESDYIRIYQSLKQIADLHKVQLMPNPVYNISF